MSTQSDFLNKIKGGAYACWKTYKVLPSVAAGQAALESAWGKSTLSTKGNNLFGVKGSYNGASVTMSTKEWVGGGFITINAAFAKYPSWGASILAYGKLIGTASHYSAAVGKTDPREQITAIWNGGYATDPNYPDLVMSVINSNNLREWDLDAFAGGDGGGFDGNIEGGAGHKNFSESLIKKNSCTRPGDKIKSIQGIVIHDIQTSANLKSVRNSLDSGNGGIKMGYHVLVSDSDAQLIVPLSEKVYHVERAASLIGGMAHPNDNLLSIGVIQKNVTSAFSAKLNVKVALVVAEICKMYKLSGTSILPSWSVDGVREPLSWYNNPFLFTAFTEMVDNAISQGDSIITNPDYRNGSSVGPDGLIPNGEGVIKNILQDAYSLLGVMTYSWQRPAQIRKGGFGDCSSFCQYLYQKHANIDIGSYTDAQWFGNWGKKIPVSEARAGDLIFFSGTYSGAGTTSHIGVVAGGGKMIDFGSSPGAKINDYNSSYWGPKIHGVKRIFSDSDYSDSRGTPEASKPTIDPNGTYVVNVKAATTAKNSDIGGVSQKRLMASEVYRVAQVGEQSLQLSNGLWVAKTADTVTLSRLETKESSIGTMTTKLATRVYNEPLVTSDRYIEQGAEKSLPAKSSINIYAYENGFAQISLRGQWAAANSIYADVDIDLYEENPLDINFEKGVPTKTIARGVLAKDGDVAAENEIPIKNMITVFANEDLLPVGSIIDIQVASNRNYNTKALVISNRSTETNGDYIQLMFTNQAQQYNFGSREVVITLLGQLKDVTEFLGFLDDPSGYPKDLELEIQKVKLEGSNNENAGNFDS